MFDASQEAQFKMKACSCQAKGGTCTTGRCPCHKRKMPCGASCRCNSILCNAMLASEIQRAMTAPPTKRPLVNFHTQSSAPSQAPPNMHGATILSEEST